MTTIFNNDSPANDSNDNKESNGDNAESAVLKKRLKDNEAFIEQLKSETAELRKELSTRMSLEEFFQKSQNNRSASNGEANSREQEEKISDGNKTVPLSVDVAALVREALAQELTNSKKAANIEATKQALIAEWGSDYVAKLESRVDELGIGREFLDDIAGRSTKAVLSLLGINQQEKKDLNAMSNLSAPPSSKKATSLSEQPASGIRNRRYYDELKKRDPKEYYTPRNQNQMHKDALELGEKFFSNN